MHPAALVGDALQAAPQCRHQAGVLVRDDEAHTTKAPFAQARQEAPPEDLVFGVTDVEAEHLAHALGGHARGDHDGLGDDVVVVAHVQVSGVEPDEREARVVQAALPEGADILVQAGTDAADLGLGDAARDAQGLDELVDGPGRHPVHVGLHDDGIEGLVDAPSWLQDAREEAALSELGDTELDVASLGRDELGTVPVALGGAVLGALVEAGPDLLGGLGLDQFLEDKAHRVTH
jgi:hypothetical protein